jgi:hypothetical protein
MILLPVVAWIDCPPPRGRCATIELELLMRDRKKMSVLSQCAADGTIAARSPRGFRHVPLQGQLSTNYAITRPTDRDRFAHLPAPQIEVARSAPGQVRRCRPPPPPSALPSIAGVLLHCHELAIWATSGRRRVRGEFWKRAVERQLPQGVVGGCDAEFVGEGPVNGSHQHPPGRVARFPSRLVLLNDN